MQFLQGVSASDRAGRLRLVRLARHRHITRGLACRLAVKDRVERSESRTAAPP